MEPHAGQSDAVVQIKAGGAPSSLEVVFKNRIATLYSGLSLARCFQCGTCSASCPTVDRMEYGPRRVMHMIDLGMIEDVLSSHDIWYCVSCFSCSVTCPQGIEIADVMAALRSLAIESGLAKDKEAIFSRVFVDVLERYGRLYEPELLLRYYAAEANVGDLLAQVGLGLRMLGKGKIGLRPERIEHVEELAEIGVPTVPRQAWPHSGAGGKER